MAAVRVASSVTSVSWIPSEAIEGITKLPFELGFGHYDPPPPDVLGDVDALHRAGGFRFANRLSAWIEVEGGRIVAAGQEGRSWISPTVIRLGPLSVRFQPTPFPDLEPEPEIVDGAARFVRIAGGRPGVPAPRPVRGRPHVKWEGPNVWTTLVVTLRADGRATAELAGASSFPRHWVYGPDGGLAAKSGVIDFEEWYRTEHDEHSPWGDEDSPAFVAMAESALERQLSATIMRSGTAPERVAVEPGGTLVEQGDPGDRLYLLLDGVLVVEVDGRQVAEVGPGAVLGERAVLEGGRRTATLRAATPCRVAVVDAADVDRDALAELAGGHRREDG